MDADDNSVVPAAEESEEKIGMTAAQVAEFAAEVAKPTKAPRKDYLTREQLLEKVDGLQMRCEIYEATINSLKKRNELLSLEAKTAAVKAHGYKLLMKEMVHEVLVTKINEPVHEEANGPTYEA